jgi:hypothetical protein
MRRLVPAPLLLAVFLGCQAAPPAPCECPPAPEPAPAADCSDLAAALESCRAKLRECEQDPFKGGKYLLGDGPDAGRPAD